MKLHRFLPAFVFLFTGSALYAQETETPKDWTNWYKGYELVWSDEFDVDGRLNDEDWDYEHGFVRNHENQWYQPENAFCENGKLIIEARKEKFENPNYVAGSSDWKRNREYVEYTSACVRTYNKHTWTYGRFEIKAKIPAITGCWPAIWTLGSWVEGDWQPNQPIRQDDWPHGGEIDIMEFYQIGGKPHLLANLAWGSNTSQWMPTWSGRSYPYSEFLAKNPNWGSEFHIWRMDWNEEAIKIYLDDKLMNYTPLAGTVNPSTGFYPWEGINPFHNPQYLLLNLALGGDNGGSLSGTKFPARYEIDYVRIYQKSATSAIKDNHIRNEMDAFGGKNQINVVFDNCSPEKTMVEIFGFSGMSIYKESLVSSSNGVVSLPPSFIPGSYLVKITRNETTITKKVIVN